MWFEDVSPIPPRYVCGNPPNYGGGMIAMALIVVLVLVL